ncbi:hypothetical protein M2436_001060 [Streptomyces sp. HB372]|nr:hypothetical protein [Streptomyces sp. HB372]
MREGRVVVAVAGVPVVPDDDQAEVLDGGEHGGPGPHDRPHRAPPHREPLPVALLGAGVGGQQGVPAVAERLGQGRVDPSGGPSVRDDDERAAPGGERRRDGPGDLGGPVRAGQGGPHRARRTAVGQCAQEGRALAVPLPGARLGGPGRGQRVRGGPGLGTAVAGRDGKLEDVGEAARVTVGDSAAEGEQVGPEDRLRGDHGGEGGQCALIVGFGEALDDEAVDQAAALTPSALDVAPARAEAHPDPDARLCVGVQLLGDGVVEVLVEVEDALVDQDAGDGQLLGERGAPPGPRLGTRHLRPAHGLPDQRKLLRRPGTGFGGLLVLAAHS